MLTPGCERSADLLVMAARENFDRCRRHISGTRSNLCEADRAAGRLRIA
jgi:hypothetical protein